MALVINQMTDLPEGSIIVRAIAVIDVIEPDGSRCLSFRCTPDIQIWEILGMAQTVVHTEFSKLLRVDPE